MIRDDWKRISGVHVTEAGDIAVVWLALDRETDTLHMYDCAIFRHETWPVIGEGIGARGRYIPMAWELRGKSVKAELEERGINMVRDGLREDDALAEVTSNGIESRMRSRRFKINKSCVEWLDEYKTFYRKETSVPRDSHPLMAATRYAVAQMDWARPLRRKKSQTRTAPKLAII